MSTWALLFQVRMSRSCIVVACLGLILVTAAWVLLALPGKPAGSIGTRASFLEGIEHGTDQISVIDQYGNALSVTTSVEAPFGNSVMACLLARFGSFVLFVMALNCSSFCTGKRILPKQPVK
jgi:hypothetical protein